MFRKAITLLFMLGISSAYGQGTGNGYIWPTKLRPELTSRFCDYRAGHFHGGLDIRTGGQVGIPLYAIADGYVFRVATSFTGYGKALYLKLRDGRIVVYGHLSGFFPSLETRILSAQLRDKKYNQDLYFTSAEFPVQQGQQIARSGESGTGAPHLHFEMRSSDNNPIDPLESGFKLADKVPPEFDELAVRHYKHGFNLGDPCEIEILPVSKAKGSATYGIGDTVMADGDLALAIAGGDRTDTPGFFYSFFGLQLLVDDSLVFQMKSDSLSYNTTRQLNYVRDLELIRLAAPKNKTDNDQGIFYRLYVPPHARQFFWPNFSDGSGIIRKSDLKSVRKVSVIAFDENGNKAELRFYLRNPDLPAPEVLSYRRAKDTLVVDFKSSFQPGRVRIESRNQPGQHYGTIKGHLVSQEGSGGRYENILRVAAGNVEGRFCLTDQENRCSPWIYIHDSRTRNNFNIGGSPNYLRIDYSTETAEPIIRISNQSLDSSMTMAPVGFGRYAADLFDFDLRGTTKFTILNKGIVSLDTKIVLYPISPDNAEEISTPDSTMVLSFQRGSAYYPAYVFPSRGTGSTTALGTAIIYDIQPAVMLADAPLNLKFDAGKLGLEEKKVGVYGYSSGSDNWNFISRIDGNRLEANAFGLGKLAILEDNEPPEISKVTPSGMTKNRKPLISCTLSDRISGMALAGGLTMTIDGVWVPAEYDIDGSRYSYKVRNPLAYGKHEIAIRAADNQGNAATKTVNFIITAK